MCADVNNDTSTKTGSSNVCQTTLVEGSQDRSVNKAISVKLTNAITEWIAVDCRPDITLDKSKLG